ncbi:MAG: hypothetical protein ABJP02_04875 [Parasphingorhabdus sp.]|uniref:hypothetical protein n=1 Tax=Parasphingorhabdus sp. TaxID=2709688 RepID=UPI0032982E9A
MTATSERGEVVLTLAGEDYVLRPSYQACSKIEELTGQSLMQLAIHADGQTLPMQEAAIVATEFIRAWGRETETKSIMGVKPERVGELMFDEGMMKVIPRLAICLAGAVTGGTKKVDSDDDEDDDTGET